MTYAILLNGITDTEYKVVDLTTFTVVHTLTQNQDTYQGAAYDVAHNRLYGSNGGGAFNPEHIPIWNNIGTTYTSSFTTHSTVDVEFWVACYGARLFVASPSSGLGLLKSIDTSTNTAAADVTLTNIAGLTDNASFDVGEGSTVLKQVWFAGGRFDGVSPHRRITRYIADGDTGAILDKRWIYEDASATNSYFSSASIDDAGHRAFLLYNDATGRTVIDTINTNTFAVSNTFVLTTPTSVIADWYPISYDAVNNRIWAGKYLINATTGALVHDFTGTSLDGNTQTVFYDSANSRYVVITFDPTPFSTVNPSTFVITTQSLNPSGGTDFYFIEAFAPSAAPLVGDGAYVPSGGRSQVFNGTTWTTTGEMTYSRYGFGYTVLPNGNVFVAGGWGTDNTQSAGTIAALDTCELYDINTGMWSFVGRTSVPHIWPSVVVVNNTVYIAGDKTSTVVDTFDIEAKNFGIAPWALPAPQYQMQSQLLTFSDGTTKGWLLAGGRNSSGTIVSTTLMTVFSSPQYSAGQTNNMYQVTVTSPTTFTIATGRLSYTNLQNSTYTSFLAAPGQIPGPYIYDPLQGLGGVTAKETALTAAIGAGNQIRTLNVTDATQLPDANGYVAIGFGNDYVAGPIPYYGRLSSTALILDYSYIFKRNIPVGAKVVLLAQKNPWVPTHPEKIGSLYLTASPYGRLTASNFIDFVAAAGVTVNKTVQYPGDYGLGNFGNPTSNNAKLTDAVSIWGSDNVDQDLSNARSGIT